MKLFLSLVILMGFSAHSQAGDHKIKCTITVGLPEIGVDGFGKTKTVYVDYENYATTEFKDCPTFFSEKKQIYRLRGSDETSCAYDTTVISKSRPTLQVARCSK